MQQKLILTLKHLHSAIWKERGLPQNPTLCFPANKGRWTYSIRLTQLFSKPLNKTWPFYFESNCFLICSIVPKVSSVSIRGNYNCQGLAQTTLHKHSTSSDCMSMISFMSNPEGTPRNVKARCPLTKAFYSSSTDMLHLKALLCSSKSKG